jgi:hypothetical protein
MAAANAAALAGEADPSISDFAASPAAMPPSMDSDMLFSTLVGDVHRRLSIEATASGRYWRPLHVKRGRCG